MSYQMVVKEDHHDTGNCRVYYEVVSVNNSPRSYKFLVCKQEETAGVWVWYTTTNDGDYNEPEGPIARRFTILDESGAVLREAETEVPA